MNLHKIPRQFFRSVNTINIKRHKSSGISSAQYCIDSVKQYDYENFMCTLLLKNSARSCAFAVRSFNVEVARVSEQVSQPNIGLMRMKFWEDTIDRCFLKDGNQVPQHPVAIEIFKALNKEKLTKRYFKTLIACRSEQISLNNFRTLEDLEAYAEKSVSSVYYLILEGCGVKNVNADHAASHLGKAQGIIQLLRSVPYSKRINLVPLPQDILAKHQVSQEEILRGKPSERLVECSFEVASRAHQHLVKARNLLNNVPKEGRAALLPAVAVDNYLTRLQHVNHDVLHPSLQVRSFRWLPRLWITNFKNKY